MLNFFSSLFLDFLPLYSCCSKGQRCSGTEPPPVIPEFSRFSPAFLNASQVYASSVAFSQKESFFLRSFFDGPIFGSFLSSCSWIPEAYLSMNQQGSVISARRQFAPPEVGRPSGVYPMMDKLSQFSASVNPYFVSYLCVT